MAFDEDVARLRQRMADAVRVGVVHPDAAGTYQQTVLQICHESERRRQSCMSQAETLRRQAAAAEAQAGAFSIIGSIAFNIVNGMIEQHERSAVEVAQQNLERAAQQAVVAPPPAEVAPEPSDTATPGKPAKKAPWNKKT